MSVIMIALLHYWDFSKNTEFFFKKYIVKEMKHYKSHTFLV